MGYDTYWFDNNDNVDNFDFTNCLFLTEGQVDEKIPLRKDCYYILHNVDQTKYKESLIDKNNILIIQVFTKDCYKRNDPVIEPFIHYKKYCDDQYFSVLYFPWATDLLPHEIENNITNLDKIEIKNDVYFVGTLVPELIPINNFCNSKNLNLKIIGGFSNNNVDTQTNQKYIQESVVAPSVQGKWQVDNGYIPCRIFKNISYGKMGITNNESVFDLFEKKIIYHEDISKCLELGLLFENNPDKNKHIVQLMNFVKEKHTYVNRINLILEKLFQN